MLQKKRQMLYDLRDDADWKLQRTYFRLNYLWQHNLCNAYTGRDNFGGKNKPLELSKFKVQGNIPSLHL